MSANIFLALFGIALIAGAIVSLETPHRRGDAEIHPPELAAGIQFESKPESPKPQQADRPSFG